jgi:hypothetical protein
MDELAEWNMFHPKSSLQIIQKRFRLAAPLFHIANSRKICSTSNFQTLMAALWNVIDSKQALNLPIFLLLPTSGNKC